MGAGCGHHETTFDGMSADYKRRLWAVIAINATMFAVEMAAGHWAGSQALKADALDFFGDALTYGISLAVIGSSLSVRANAALSRASACWRWASGCSARHSTPSSLPACRRRRSWA